MRLFSVLLALVCVASSHAEIFYLSIDASRLSEVECYDPETCFFQDARITVRDIMQNEFTISGVVQTQGESVDGWYLIGFDLGANMPPFSLLGIAVEFGGPGFYYLVEQEFASPYNIAILPLPPGVCDYYVIPPGDGCIEPAAAEELEHSFELQNAYPNPCNGSAVIEYSLPATQQAELAVYNLRGQQMALLASGLQEAGEHSVRVEMDTWPSGVYLCQLQTATLSQSRRLLLVR